MYMFSVSSRGQLLGEARYSFEPETFHVTEDGPGKVELKLRQGTLFTGSFLVIHLNAEHVEVIDVPVVVRDVPVVPVVPVVPMDAPRGSGRDSSTYEAALRGLFDAPDISLRDANRQRGQHLNGDPDWKLGWLKAGLRCLGLSFPSGCLIRMQAT